jgi:hypothetical protein
MPVALLAIGATVSHHGVVANVSSGGMGEVYEVKDTGLRCFTALRTFSHFLPTHRQRRT